MTKRMLIDAAHPEETRVVVLDGGKLEEFDLETAHRRPLKGNIYLAKVVRVEPSLQAAFVEYGGNRHGFLAFGEIHPDYYQIPVADRQRLIALQAAEARAEEEAEERASQAREARGRRPPRPEMAEPDAGGDDITPPQPGEELPPPDTGPEITPTPPGPEITPPPAGPDISPPDTVPEISPPPAQGSDQSRSEAAQPLEVRSEHRVAKADEDMAAEEAESDLSGAGEEASLGGDRNDPEHEDQEPPAPPPEMLGGEDPGGDDENGDGDSNRERRSSPNFLRHYKIQEVIRRRQILLIQVVKEERGSKGAALTTFISLAGRFSVLMPNSPRGGGVSRKITSATDRKRLREAIDEVGLPDGMSLIVRTAGANRPKPEIRRDCEYLLRLWDSIRDRTLASTAPALIYEEADLIKRSIRDVFSRDVDELLVEGEDAFQQAREFMRMLMPANAQKVRLHREPTPLFARHGVDAALDAMNSPTVQLRSGGYIVINQTEALVAIDVNSGRATRERHIEDTALRTNLEAAEEIARQLRLRDLAGLIVIDFIDMESPRHDAMVEKRLKDQLRHDRARIQVGRISHFGLLEMSRQRLRPSIAEHNTIACVHCQGRGFVRSVESSALQVLRAIEEEGARRRSAEIVIHVAGQVALYLLNRKRDRLAQIEDRWGMSVMLQPDETLAPPNLRVERVRALSPDAVPVAQSALRMDYAAEREEPAPEEEDEVVAAEVGAADQRAETPDEAERSRRRRRRRGRGRREDGQADEAAVDDAASASADASDEPSETTGDTAPEDAAAEVSGESPAPGTDAERDDEGDRRRRRGRRGGRRRRSEGGDVREGGESASEAPDDADADLLAGDDAVGSTEPASPPEERPAVVRAPRPARYAGPTPADPFAGQTGDIFSVMAAAEAAAEALAEAASRAPRREAVEHAVVEAAPAEALATSSAVAAEPSFVEAVPEPAASVQAGDDLPSPPLTEPVAAPAIQPIVLDQDAADVLPKRRGWWKR